MAFFRSARSLGKRRWYLTANTNTNVNAANANASNCSTAQNLNDFFELHSEELRNDLLRRRRGSLGSAGAGAGDEESTEDNTKNVNTNHGEFSLRIHELYREFLRVVQANLEGRCPVGAW